MEIRAIREISAGEQLTVCYVNMTEPRKIRAAELRATKHFSCACERCSEPLAASPDMMLEVRNVFPMSAVSTLGTLEFGEGRHWVRLTGGNTAVPCNAIRVDLQGGGL